MPSDFKPTRWSLVIRADAPDNSAREQAWKELDQLYRTPLLKFIASQGWEHSEAEDLLQTFFAKMIECSWLKEADQDRGKLRTFLLFKLKGHISDARKKAGALKRGGHLKQVELEVHDLPHVEAPSSIFDRYWAETLLHRAFDSLQSEYAEVDRIKEFQLLKPYLTGEAPDSMERLGQQLDTNAHTARMRLVRLRTRFREGLRAEVIQTLLPDEDLNAELRYLSRVLSQVEGEADA